MHAGFNTPDNQCRVKLVHRGLHGASGNFADRARLIVAETAFGLSTLDQVRRCRLGSLSPCKGAQGPGLLCFGLSLRKQAVVVGHFFCREHFILHKQLQTVCVGFSAKDYFWYYFVRLKDCASFSTGWTRPHFTSSSPFSSHQRATA